MIMREATAVDWCRALQALEEFCHHAEETNDVFLLAAKVIATVLVRARLELERQAKGDGTMDASEHDLAEMIASNT